MLFHLYGKCEQKKNFLMFGGPVSTYAHMYWGSTDLYIYFLALKKVTCEKDYDGWFCLAIKTTASIKFQKICSE